ncbi:unnamed protein product [Caenorhabditis brenneri]
MENIHEDVVDFGVDDMEMEALDHDNEMKDNELLGDLDEQYQDFDEGIGGSVTSIDSMENGDELLKETQVGGAKLGILIHNSSNSVSSLWVLQFFAIALLSLPRLLRSRI